MDPYPQTGERIYRLVTPAVTEETSGPVILTSPRSATVFSTEALKLTVLAVGQGMLSYQWQRNGSDLPGANGAELILSGATLLSGRYTVVVGDATGTVESAGADVVVRERN